MIHDGRNDPRDQASLKHWGSIYRARLGRPRFQPTPHYDATMQKAVAEVQRLNNLPVTGQMGPDEWRLVFTMDRPPATYQKPPRPFAELQRKQHRKNVRDYWRRYSKWQIKPGSDPNAPPWFPGRVYGYPERGPHVNPVLAYFGLKENECFSSVLAQRVRGFQKRMGLPISGLVDARTASLIQDEIDSRQAQAVEQPDTP